MNDSIVAGRVAAPYPSAGRARVAGVAAALAALLLLAGPAGADQVINDDLIVNGGAPDSGGSVCAGFDCVNNEDFGFDTLRLKENNLRIKFDDTSSAAAFPSNDWSIVVNDSQDGGNSFFAIVDETAGQTLLKICAVGDATCTPIVPSGVIPDDGTDADGEPLTGSTAIGAGAKVTGTAGTAIGAGAQAGSFDTALGFNAQVSADGSVAVGANSTAGAQNSVALGADARVLAGAPGSVALGQGSVASEPNTVSVGAAGSERRITNVAAGVNPHDAVNVRQLDRLDDRVDDVGALAAAFSALAPNPRAGGNTQLSVGFGAYEGSTAVAGGLYHYLRRNVLLNAGVSVATGEGEVAGRAGVTFSW